MYVHAYVNVLDYRDDGLSVIVATMYTYSDTCVCIRYNLLLN